VRLLTGPTCTHPAETKQSSKPLLCTLALIVSSRGAGPLSLDLAAASLKNHYFSLCVTPTSTICKAATLGHTRVLQPVQERPDSNSQPATATSSDKHPADKGGSCDRAVSEWLQTVNASGSKILQTVNSDHMLVCFTHPWLPHHAGLAIRTEGRIAAPSTGCLSMLGYQSARRSA